MELRHLVITGSLLGATTFPAVSGEFHIAGGAFFLRPTLLLA